jgi:hypothetical protein
MRTNTIITKVLQFWQLSAYALSDTDQGIEELSKLFFVLSRPDNLALFLLAKDGFRSRTSTPLKLGFTKKQYYTRINQLLQVRLITHNSENLYIHTTLGKMIFYNHVVPMMEGIKHANNLLMIDELEDSKKFSPDQIKKFAGLLFEKINLRVSDKSPKLQFLLSDVEIQREMLKSILLCQREIVYATRAHVHSFVKEVMTKAVAGVTVRVLVDNKLESYIGTNLERVFFNDYIGSAKPTASKYMSLHEHLTVRKSKIPFDILLIDGSILIIGLIDRENVEKYNAIIKVEDPEISKDVSDLCRKLWEGSEATQKISLVEQDDLRPYPKKPVTKN